VDHGGGDDGRERRDVRDLEMRTNPTMRWVLRWTQRALFVCAAVLLGYCGFVVIDTWTFQHRERQHLELLLVNGRPEPPAAGDGLLGRIDIPRLGLSAVVVEGTTRAVLRRAVGHIVGTGVAGQPGNIGLAGHRDTFFRPLRNIRHYDIITLTTLQGEYRYRVVSTKVVHPNDVAVLDSDGNEIMTLVTCYPFYFIGSAPERFIVRAERII
jgi:sortase A